MENPSDLARIIRDEWAMIALAPYNFFGALLFGWFLIWLAMLAWHRRSRRILQDQADLFRTERDVERRQKEGLRNALAELRPDISILAMEIAYGDPEIKQVVDRLATGERIETPIDPSNLPERGVTIMLAPSEIRKIALLAYTSASGLSQTASVSFGQVHITTGTPVVSTVQSYIRRREAKNKE